MVTNIDKNNFEEEVIKSNKPVLIDFWASWCGPCKMMGPVFESLSEEMTDIKFVKVNTEEASNVATQFNIMSIPTLVLVDGGKEKNRLSGFLPKDQLKQAIEQMKK